MIHFFISLKKSLKNNYKGIHQNVQKTEISAITRLLENIPKYSHGKIPSFQDFKIDIMILQN